MGGFFISRKDMNTVKTKRKLVSFLCDGEDKREFDIAKEILKNADVDIPNLSEVFRSALKSELIKLREKHNHGQCFAN